MKRMERIIIKLIICQAIFMFLAQWMLYDSTLKTYLNRVYQYEGIYNGKQGKTVETIDHSNLLWYDE